MPYAVRIRNKAFLIVNFMSVEKIRTAIVYYINNNVQVNVCGYIVRAFSMDMESAVLPMNRRIWWCIGFIYLSFVSVHNGVIETCVNFLCSMRIFTQYIFIVKWNYAKAAVFCSVGHTHLVR